MEVDETYFFWYKTYKLTIPVCSARNDMQLKYVCLFCFVCLHDDQSRVTEEILENMLTERLTKLWWQCQFLLKLD